ncbi:MAG: hypothetical protein RR232_06455 [Clostridia bacterium]
MADKFDELMQNIADVENAAVDFDALHAAIAAEQIKRTKHTWSLTRTLSAAAAFVLLIGVGVMMTTHGQNDKFARSESAPAPASQPQSASYAAPAPNQPTPVADACAVPDPKQPAPSGCGIVDDSLAESGEDLGSYSTSNATAGTTDEQTMVELFPSLSSSRLYTIGVPNLDSCAAFYGNGETIGKCSYTKFPCDAPIIEIGQVCMKDVRTDAGDTQIWALWQTSDTEYVLVKADVLEYAELVEILLCMV